MKYHSRQKKWFRYTYIHFTIGIPPPRVIDVVFVLSFGIIVVICCCHLYLMLMLSLCHKRSTIYIQWSKFMHVTWKALAAKPLVIINSLGGRYNIDKTESDSEPRLNFKTGRRIKILSKLVQNLEKRSCIFLLLYQNPMHHIYSNSYARYHEKPADFKPCAFLSQVLELWWTSFFHSTPIADARCVNISVAKFRSFDLHDITLLKANTAEYFHLLSSPGHAL